MRPTLRRLRISRAAATAIAPVNLLLQNYAVHAGLEQRKRQAGLALEVAQSVEDFGRGVRRKVFKYHSELPRRKSGQQKITKSDLNTKPAVLRRIKCKALERQRGRDRRLVPIYLLHVVRQPLILIEDLLLQGRELRRRQQAGGTLIHGERGPLARDALAVEVQLKPSNAPRVVGQKRQSWVQLQCIRGPIAEYMASVHTTVCDARYILLTKHLLALNTTYTCHIPSFKSHGRKQY